ncbi:MAG: M28 family metallopeptidase [Kiritimatiellales bacterium]
MLVQTACGITVSGIVSQISRQDFQQAHTNFFVGDGQSRGFTGDLDANTPRVPAFQHDATRDYIRTRFEEFGLTTSLDPFWFTTAYGITYTYTNCNNVVALQYGAATNAGWYIIGGHYDSVDTGQNSQQSPGADDNASGTAGVLELARVLSRYTFRNNIAYIAFDAEEKGLQGAWHFANTHTTTDPAQTNRILRSAVRGMISLDMIAYNPGTANSNRVRIYGGNSSPAAPVQAALKYALTNYTSIAVYDSGSISASDHHPFYAYGMDACLLIEYEVWSNPWYHKTNDSVNSAGYIDYDYAAELTRGAAAYCCEQAGIILPATLTPPDVRPENKEAVFAWSAQSGSVYRIKYTGNLMDTNSWQMLGMITNFHGWKTLSITDQVETVSQRFYRVENVYEQ